MFKSILSNHRNGKVEGTTSLSNLMQMLCKLAALYTGLWQTNTRKGLRHERTHSPPCSAPALLSCAVALPSLHSGPRRQ